MKRIQITVIRKVCHKDLMEKYENPMEHACDMEEGQVFIANALPMAGKNRKAYVKARGKPCRPL